MGQHQRIEENKSLNTSRKNLIASTIAIIGLSISACKSTEQKTPLNADLSRAESQIPQSFDQELGTRLTVAGFHQQLSLSPDGKKILFTSQKRRAHSHQQVYMIDLELQRERRLTFNDGDSHSPVFVNDQEYLYLSNTDQLKEKPLLMYPNAKIGVDVYLAEASGPDIMRLTSDDGQKTEIIPLNRPKGLFYILNNQNSKSKLTTFNLKSKSNQNLYQFNSEISFFRPSPDGKLWAWIEKSQEGQSVLKISTALKGDTLTDELKSLGEIHSFDWISSSRLILSGKQSTDTKSRFEIWVYDFSQKCLTPFLKSGKDLLSPLYFEQKKSTLLVAADDSGSQIYLKNADPIATLCSPQK